MVNQLTSFLFKNNAEPPVICYTNQPDGWAAYKKIINALQTEFGDAAGPHLWMPLTTPLFNMDENQKFLDKIPDLSSGTHALEDILVAMEWLQSLLACS